MIQIGASSLDSQRPSSGEPKGLNFNIPDVRIQRVDSKEVRSKIMSTDPSERKELKINKSTLWYQHQKIKEGAEIKAYGGF